MQPQRNCSAFCKTVVGQAGKASTVPAASHFQFCSLAGQKGRQQIFSSTQRQWILAPTQFGAQIGLRFSSPDRREVSLVYRRQLLSIPAVITGMFSP